MMNVILPQPIINAEETEGRVEFPTLWLLHGLSNDHSTWLRQSGIERYALRRGLAVVMPSVERSFYKDIPNGPRFGEFIREELPRLARAVFPLSTRREDNFIAGVSMGGYGAFLLALSRPDRFAAAASLAGVLDLPLCLDNLDEKTPLSPQEADHLFSDIDSVRGSDYDLLALARRAVAAGTPLPHFYVQCGRDDYLYRANQSFLAGARQIGLSVHYHESAGEHEWDFFDLSIEKVIDWLPLKTPRVSPAQHGRQT